TGNRFRAPPREIAPALGVTRPAHPARAWSGSPHEACPPPVWRQVTSEFGASCPTTSEIRTARARPGQGATRLPPDNAWRESGSEQADDVPVGVDVDALAARLRGEARHRPHLAEERRDEARAGRELH